jgi:hypothetical protein
MLTYEPNDELPCDRCYEETEEPGEFFSDDLTREECEELMAAMDRYVKKVQKEMSNGMRIYTSKEYSQEFLQSLVQKKGRLL